MNISIFRCSAAVWFPTTFLFCIPGTLDKTFNACGSFPGTKTTKIDRGFSQANSIALQQDGKLVVAGSSTTSASGGGFINSFAVARFTVDGSLDRTFNTNGSKPGTICVEIGEPTNGIPGRSVALQTDGKIVVAGTITVNGVKNFAVARYNKNGTLDTTFNAHGKKPGTTYTTIGGPANNSDCAGVALQQDGKIVVAGGVDIVGATSNIGVARFNADGTLDTTFDPSGSKPGTAYTTVGGDIYSQGQGIVLQSDGKIVISGTIYIADGGGDIERIAVARFTTDGVLDTTFNANGPKPGTAATAIGGSDVYAYAQGIALQQDGKIVVVGSVFADLKVHFCVARFTPDGALDRTFNGSGVQPGTAYTTIDKAGHDSHALGVTLAPNGAILLAGYVVLQAAGEGINEIDECAIVRFTPDGALDTAFNPSGSKPGTALIHIGGSCTSSSCSAIALQSDGKIIVAGSVSRNTAESFKFAVARLHGDVKSL